VFPQMANASPLRAERVRGTDILFVRELTGGLYFGEPRYRDHVDGRQRAVDTLEYYDDEVQRIVRLACKLAGQRRGLVTSVDKANILETSRLWRETATAIAEEYPNLRLEHQLVDSMAMRLLQDAPGLDVVVRHPQRRGFGPGRLPGHAAQRIPGRRNTGGIRTCPRFSTRYRRERNRQPDRRDPERSHAAASFHGA